MGDSFDLDDDQMYLGGLYHSEPVVETNNYQAQKQQQQQLPTVYGSSVQYPKQQKNEISIRFEYLIIFLYVLITIQFMFTYMKMEQLRFRLKLLTKAKENII
jgi:hypothetical protein